MSSFKPRYGASPNPAGGFDFRIWAPKQKRLGIRIGGQDHDLQPGDGGEFTGTIPTAAAGQDYQVVLADGQARPDPASRWQPDGVHGPSRLFDPRFAFSDIAWRGVALGELIFYELHSGTFTREGTFDGIATKLDYLCDLGITAVELMPAVEFPGRRNWGYDGVNLYAPHSAYGGPEGLQRMVDACHAKGLAVFLDVVYNHFGPEGNYLCDFAPYFTSAYQTPWGNAIDFSAPQVRRYFIDNALYWLANFHIDGLRLDALHEIYDESEPHFLEELSREFTETAKSLGRQAWLIAESERDDIRKRGIHSIWHDEFHHALAPVLTSNRRGYLGRYGKHQHIAAAVSEGFVLWESDGNWKPTELTAFVQNHDQVANPFLGDRHGTLLTYRQQQVVAALLCFSPWLPLLFMGQEFGETNPFLYFVSHTDSDLLEAVRNGRRREFEAFYSTREFPDPGDPHTFEKSRLDWGKVSQAPYSDLLATYRDLLRLRKRLAAVGGPGEVECRADGEQGTIVIVRPDATLIASLSDAPAAVAIDCAEDAPVLFSTTPAPVAQPGVVTLEAWSVVIYASAFSSGVTGSIHGQHKVPIK